MTTEEEIKLDAAKEDNDMIVRRFVGMVGYDYINHYKKNTPQIHPDFSAETRIFWREIESRLKEPTTLKFKWKECIECLEKKAKDQAAMCKTADHTSSYHYGLKSAYWEAIRIISDYIEEEEDGAELHQHNGQD